MKVIRTTTLRGYLHSYSHEEAWVDVLNKEVTILSEGEISELCKNNTFWTYKVKLTVELAQALAPLSTEDATVFHHCARGVWAGTVTPHPDDVAWWAKLKDQWARDGRL